MSARYLLIGDPVEHSPSPAFQQAAFDALGIDAVYEARTVPSGELDALWASLDDVAGFNVTIPHKTDVLARVVADETAATIGAVNTVKREDGSWRGTNTDAQGLLDALVYYEIRATQVAVLGSGGAARAVAWALEESGVQPLIVARNLAAAAELGTAASFEEPHEVELVISTLPPSAFADAEAWLATSNARVFLDVAYGADQATPLTRWASARGRQAHDGSEMLLRQGAHAFHYWTGLDMPLSTCREVIARHLRSSTNQ